MVNLDEPRFQLFVNQDVKAENFEAHRVHHFLVAEAVIHILCLIRNLQIMLQTWLYRAECFDDYLLDLMHHFFFPLDAIVHVLLYPF